MDRTASRVSSHLGTLLQCAPDHGLQKNIAIVAVFLKVGYEGALWF